MDKESQISRISTDRKHSDAERTYAVMLPCAPENFAEFILGLLGESQILESRVWGLFVVGRDEITNITDIISQRVSQQNESSLLSWSLTVTYDDGTNVKHSSVKEFVGYAEIKAHIAISFTLRMSFLVKFQERATFEKQSIDVTFVSGYSGPSQDFIEYPSARRRVGAGFQIRIEHTLRSWGVDLESLLQNRLRGFKTIHESTIKKLLNQYSGYIQTALSLGFFTLSMFGLVYQTNKNASAQAVQINGKLAGVPESQKAIEGIKMTVEQVSSGAIQKNVILALVFVLLFSIFSIVIAISTDNILRLQRTGVLLLTPQADDYLKKIEKPFFPYASQLIFTAVSSVTAGVIANYLFAWLIRS